MIIDNWQLVINLDHPVCKTAWKFVTILDVLHCLSVPNQDVYQLYAHGKDSLLILTYQASRMQKMKSVQILIEAIAK